MRKHVRAEIARQTGGMLRQGAPDQVVGTSKTFRQLARIAGAAPSGEGLYVTRILRHADVAALAERLPKMTQAERSKLPGVSVARVPQLPAGAIVADAIMELLGVDQLELCPWALREGVILRRLDMLAQGLGALPVMGRQARCLMQKFALCKDPLRLLPAACTDCSRRPRRPALAAGLA